MRGCASVFDNDGMSFTTHDRDNDKGSNCAQGSSAVHGGTMTATVQT